MKLFFLLVIFIIVCISNFNFIHAAPGEIVFKILVPDNIEVDNFNIGGKVKAGAAAAAVEPETTPTTTTSTTVSTTTAPKEIPAANAAKSLEDTDEE